MKKLLTIFFLFLLFIFSYLNRFNGPEVHPLNRCKRTDLHQLSARLAPVLAASGLSAQKIVRYIETVAMRVAIREVATSAFEVRRNQHQPTTSNARHLKSRTHHQRGQGTQ